MTLRPEPVTSKFRRYYKNEIIPIYQKSNLSLSSSAGSTSSLTSILHHGNCQDLKEVLQNESCDDLPINFNNFNSINLPENSNELKDLYSHSQKSKKQNGIIREYINSSPTINCRMDKNNQFLKRSCKRIIARKPDYPGFRFKDVSYDEDFHEKQFQKTFDSSKSYHKNSVNKPKNKQGESKIDTYPKLEAPNRIKRKKNSTKTHENDEKEMRVKSASDVPDRHLTIHDSTVSNSVPIQLEEQLETSQVTGSKKPYESESKRDGLPGSSVNDVESFISEDAPDSSFSSRSNFRTDESSNADAKTTKSPHRLLTAWEGWFLRKEEQDRKVHEQERKKMQIEEAKRKEEEKLKQERREVCEKKITEWLKKKEEERAKSTLEKQRQEKKQKELLECKKDDSLKKSSEKYIEWKMKKLELQKEKERQTRVRALHIEREKVIKLEKAQYAFTAWLDQHRDHQLPVPYSYGISDGKLTSYYDKTSNPPPAYFNPKLWVSVLESK